MDVSMATVTQYLQKPSWQEQRETLVPFPLTISPLKVGRVSCWDRKRTGAIVPAGEGANLPGIRVNSLITCHHTLQARLEQTMDPQGWMAIMYSSVFYNLLLSLLATLNRTPFSAFHCFLLRLPGPWALTITTS